MIYKITPCVDQIYWLKSFYTQLNKSTNPNSLKVTKIAKPTNKNIFFTNFGDLCNKQPIVPSLPEFENSLSLLWNTFLKLNQNKDDNTQIPLADF